MEHPAELCLPVGEDPGIGEVAIRAGGLLSLVAAIIERLSRVRHLVDFLQQIAGRLRELMLPLIPVAATAMSASLMAVF
jgi:hypothetical protein